jgi:hypothetical protein
VPLSAEVIRLMDVDDDDDDYIETTEADRTTRLGAMDSLRGLVQGAALEATASETPADEPTHTPTPDLAEAQDRMTLAQSEKEIAALLKGAADWHPADQAPLIEAAAKRREALKA